MSKLEPSDLVSVNSADDEEVYFFVPSDFVRVEYADNRFVCSEWKREGDSFTCTLTQTKPDTIIRIQRKQDA